MNTASSSRTDRSQSCPDIAVRVVGAGPTADMLVERLQQDGHPVEVSAAATQAGTSPTVVLLLCRSVSECCELADVLHQRWPQAAVVIVSDHVSIALEDQVGVREFATLRKKSANGNEFHALVHDVLRPVPDTTPHALKPRTTDHPPSSR